MKHLALSILIALTGALAIAQPAKSTGTIRGTVIEKRTKEKAVGVTVVLTSPALTGEQVVLTDENGAFSAPVPAGTYTITYYYNNTTLQRKNVVVKPGGVASVADSVDVPPPDKSDVIVITGTPFEPFTITGPDLTLTRAEDTTLTLQRKGKPTVSGKLDESSNGVLFADGKRLLVMKLANENAYELVVNTKTVGMIYPKGVLEIGKKKLWFNAKGELVGSALKLKVSPARLGQQVETLGVLAAFLRDQL